MSYFRYFHIADCHLDAPFHNLPLAQGTKGTSARELAGRVRNAPFEALDAIRDMAITERPDAVVFAGDITNSESRSIRARMALRDFCLRLGEAAIPVFIVHGNHDPLSKDLAVIALPANATVFGTAYERHILSRNGGALAVFHGISHGTRTEGRNLARLFERDEGHRDLFQLGILHCSLDGREKRDRYAPCSLADLRDAELDAWALGHIHAPAIVSPVAPFAAYAGSVQGLDATEQGTHGFYDVRVERDPHTGAFSCNAQLIQVAPVLRLDVPVDLAGTGDIGEVTDRIRQAAERSVKSCLPPSAAIRIILVRLRLSGMTQLDSELRGPGTMAEIMELLPELWPDGTEEMPELFFLKPQIATSPAHAHGNLAAREDLLGTVLRTVADLKNNPDALALVLDATMKPLGDKIGRERPDFMTKREDGQERSRMDMEILLEAERLLTDGLLADRAGTGLEPGWNRAGIGLEPGMPQKLGGGTAIDPARFSY